jgi:acyl-CoA synthetase (AMP-forming)/AMP-acid ligase II
MLLSDGLACAAVERPYEEAIAFGDRRLTWSEWHERIRRVAGALAAEGIGRGDRVAVIDRNHIAVLDVILAAGTLGAATVVPNWRLKDAELSYVLRDSSPRLIVLGAAFTDLEETMRKALPSIERIVHLDDEYEAWLGAAEPADPALDTSPDDTVLVIYTSGTTGPAKGAMFTHRGMAANAEVSPIVADAGPGDRVLVSMPLFHIGGAGTALAAITDGIPVTVLTEPTPQALVEAIEEGATRAFLVPAVIARMLHEGQRERTSLASLSLLAYGGSPCPRPILEEVLAAMPNAHVVQVYGMTELCGSVTTLSDAAHRDAKHPERLAAAGQVIPGVDMRIVDPTSLVDVEPGEVGELWFLTPKRMSAYLGQPESTAQVVVDGGWIRTGDMGRIDEQGFVFIVDRLKDLIITGGENVFSPEVESVVIDHPSVDEAAVIGVPHPTMGESIVAVVVAAPGQSIDPEGLIAYTRERLAGFKCPRAVVVVGELPRNAFGKVLKRELRDQIQARGTTTA